MSESKVNQNAEAADKWQLLCITLFPDLLVIETRRATYETGSRFARVVTGVGIRVIQFVEKFSKKRNGSTYAR